MRDSIALLVLGVACAARAPTPGPSVIAIGQEPSAARDSPKPGAERAPLTRFRYSERVLSEAGWLRERFEAELEGVQFGTLINELRAWVTPGRATEVFTMQTGDCEPGELYLAEDLAEPEVRRTLLEAQQHTPDSLDAFGLVLRFGLKIEEEDGERRRSYGSARVAQRINYGSGSTGERWVDGRWVAETGWGLGDGGTDSGVLSKVEPEAVYFDGVALSGSAECAGEVNITCANGGVRSCPGCTEVGLTLARQTTMRGYVTRKLTRKARSGPVCNLPCPETQEHPDKARADEILKQVELWRVGTATLGTIFRSRERCEHELASVQAVAGP
jgi:hypothetical protein